jgi:hypothetical protein
MLAHSKNSKHVHNNFQKKNVITLNADLVEVFQNDCKDKQNKNKQINHLIYRKRDLNNVDNCT